jgi:integrase
VFRSETGGPLHHRNIVRRGLEKAIENAKLDNDGKPPLRWHDLRHTYASMIGQGWTSSTSADGKTVVATGGNRPSLTATMSHSSAHHRAQATSGKRIGTVHTREVPGSIPGAPMA